MRISDLSSDVCASDLSHAIKRMTTHRKPGLVQMEAWYAYTPEQDRWGLSEKDIRAFGICFDMQDDRSRNFVGLRYLNSVNGEMKKQWQYMNAADVTDEEWAYRSEEHTSELQSLMRISYAVFCL